MGLWSSTFGDGNSFAESVANTFTKDDGASYVKGNLVNDSDGTSLTAGSTAKGTTNVISGNANTTSNDGTVGSDGKPVAKAKGVAPASLTGADAALGIMAPITLVPSILTGIANWSLDLDPTNQSVGVIGGRQVYDNGQGYKYSYNLIGQPYEVVVDGQTVKDKLGMSVNAETGILDPNGTITGYEYNRRKAVATGGGGGGDGNKSVVELNQYEQNNIDTNTVEGTPSPDDIIAMAEKAGIIQSQADSKAIIANPTKFLADRNLTLADIMPKIDANTEGTTLDGTNPNYDLEGESGYTASGSGDAATVGGVTQPDAVTYDAEQVNLTDAQMVDAATGTVSEEATVNADEYTVDMTGAATGINADGTKNELGSSLNEWASVDLSKIVDTSTVSGKLLADKLNAEGKDFVDAKTSILFQMKTIAAEFTNSQGNAVIPPWAAASHRDVMKSIAFNDITGTAAVDAMSNAIMEATLGVAEKEAIFFQTLTTTNLSNKQEAIINKANILSKLEMTNVDVRSQAAIQNAKNFMEMDLSNLSNEQQAEVVNKQAMVQEMFDNAKAKNAERLFSAEAQNDVNKFYSELQVSIDRHNSSEQNALKKFNAGEINDASEFSADIKNDRQQFLASMQYNIDFANAGWRKTVTTTNNQIAVDAHTADVKSALDLTQEAQNQLWDSADNILDYIWRTTDNDMEREMRLLMAEMTAQSGQSSGSGFMSGLLKLGGAYIGSTSGSQWLTKTLTG